MKHQCAVIGALVMLFVLLGAVAFFAKNDPSVMSKLPGINSSGTQENKPLSP